MLNYKAPVPVSEPLKSLRRPPNELFFLLNGEGTPINFQYGGPTDESGQPLPGDSGLVLMLKRKSKRIIDSILKRGETVLGQWTRELSLDGQAIKMTQYVLNQVAATSRTPAFRDALHLDPTDPEG